MLFSLLKNYLELCIHVTAIKVSRYLYCFTTSISYDVQNYFPRLWGTGISDALFASVVKRTKLLFLQFQQDIKILIDANNLDNSRTVYFNKVENTFQVYLTIS